MLYYKSWEILTGVADIAAGEEDVLLAGVILGEGKIALCLKPLAVIVGMNAKYPLDQQPVNQFIVVAVLKKWEMRDQIRQDLKGLISKLRIPIKIKASLKY